MLNIFIFKQSLLKLIKRVWGV